MTTSTDVVIVGSGAGGSGLAYAFANAGFSVTVLEKGPRHAAADFVHDEILGEPGVDVFTPSIDDDPHMLVELSPDGREPRRTLDGWSASCVGGGTMHMGASLHRMHPSDFRLRSFLGSFESVADWPYTYEDLEPYYTRAEWLLGVSGSDDGLPTELRRSRPLPMEPLRSHPLVHRFDAVCRARSLGVYATPRGINSRPYDDRPACEYCDLCAGFGCPNGARAGAQDTLLRRAEATGRCEIKPNTMVTEVLVGPRRRATSVRYIDRGGAEHVATGSVICISASAIESARLLLRSRAAGGDTGIGNANGLVGQFLHFHISSAGRGKFDQDPMERATPAGRNPFLGRSTMEYYFLPPAVSSYAKGGLHEFDMERSQPIAIARRTALGSGTVASADGRAELLWGVPLKRALKGRLAAQCAVDFEVFQDGFANSGTYMDLDPGVRDKWGLPVARIQYTHLDHYREAGRWLVDRGLEILDAMGATTTRPLGIGIRNGYMVHGTCRAGSDPRTSVLDPFCRVHDVPNLFVIDGSFMPASGAAPATLTIVANALRCADHIIDRARSYEL
jgi:choline dehydrogenase-like flavoprotein